MNSSLSLVFWQARRRLAGRKQWWWTLTAANEEVVGGSTEGYDNFADCVSNANLVLGLRLSRARGDGPSTVSRHVGFDNETRFRVSVDQ